MTARAVPGPVAAGEATAAGQSNSPWSDAVLAAALFAIDPVRLGGIVVRAHAGPVRDRWQASVLGLTETGKPVRKVPLQVSDERLLGGLDLAATLRAGRAIAARGLIAEADGGVILLACAERVEASTASRLTAALDLRAVALERDGFTLRYPAAFGVIAFDEGLSDDEAVSSALRDRLAFAIDLQGIRARDAVVPGDIAARVIAARRLFDRVEIADDVLASLCGAALALGIESSRAPLFAVHVARAAAALEGRLAVCGDDAALAARLVLAPRAMVLPSDAPPPPEPDQPEPPPEDADGEQQREPPGDAPLEDVVLAAALAALPPGLLARLMAERAMRSRGVSTGRAGAVQKTLLRGRPAGTRRGDPRTGARLSVIETLRAAAPWQPVRRRERAGASPRLEIRRDDFRVSRYTKRSESTTIFVVDASGSAALQRLAEAKGAVELMLAESYVRRDHVALISFRGTSAELLLAPTRSLVRAKRCLAALPGGGGTPLATALSAALLLADGIRRRGQTPSVVMLTDGRANVARDGTGGRPQAEIDALTAARAFRASGHSGILIDTSRSAAPQAEKIAREMGAIYLPLPYANAQAVTAAVRTATSSHGGRPG